MKRGAFVCALFAFSFVIVILSIHRSSLVPRAHALTPYPTVTISNGILNVTVQALPDMTGVGTFTIGTWLNHPKPGFEVLYGHPNPGTTYATVKVVDTHNEYVTTKQYSPVTSPGYTLKYLDESSPEVTADERKVTVTWKTAEHLAITQIIEITGNHISNTLVRVSLSITNNDNATHTVGVRYEWDIKIDGRDGSYLRPWTDPNTPQDWEDREKDWASPDFQFWEATDNATYPLFSIYGSVTSPPAMLQPTKPDRLVLADWTICYWHAYDYNATAQVVGGDGRDSAVLYYWDPVNLTSGASREVTAYITTFKEAIQTKTETAAWAPSAEGALVAGALTVGVTSGVSAVASAVGHSRNYPSNNLTQKINDALPEPVKKWLEAFISSKTEEAIELRAGISFLLTRYEIFSLIVSVAVVTFAFSYAKAETLDQILPLIPVVLVTSVMVELVKDFAREVVARSQGVWCEYRLWYFGLAMLLISSIAFKAPFAMPSRVRNHSAKCTSRSVGLISLTSVIVPLIFAVIFYWLFVNGFTLIGNMGLVICATMAFFDIIPIPPMNGKDIYDWSKVLWLALFIACFALYVLCLLLL